MKKELFKTATKVDFSTYKSILVYLFDKQNKKFKKIPKKKKTIVFDIDGCLVDKFGKSENKITPVIELYRHCLKNKIIPYIITARPAFPENINNTLLMLKELIDPNNKYKNWFKNAYFMNTNFNDPFIYKEDSRKHIKKGGEHILMAIGDNWCDFNIFDLSTTSVFMKMPENEYGHIIFSYWN